MAKELAGNCYYASEALYHLLAGKKSGWKPMQMTLSGAFCGSHWFLKHSSGLILDASKRQFSVPGGKGYKPNYNKARGRGFLTKRPSIEARRLIRSMTWYQE